MNEWIDGWMDGWMDERADGQMNEQSWLKILDSADVSLYNPPGI